MIHTVCALSLCCETSDLQHLLKLSGQKLQLATLTLEFDMPFVTVGVKYIQISCTDSSGDLNNFNYLFL